ncbi:MAG: hypothetical protein IJ736_03980 [Firmicutes bacterium]|nr:hypothetical protein [Bacillota bacterium]
MNKYEIWLIDELQKIENFPYKDIKSIDKYPSHISKKVLKVLIENACLGQNYAPIELGRKKINEISKEWLNKNFLEVAYSSIDYSDEWEYRRLVELVVLVVPELIQEVLDIGRNSENAEIREVVEDYAETGFKFLFIK